VRFEALQIRILADIDRAHTSFAAVLVKWCDAEKQTQLQPSLSESALINRTPKRAPDDPYLN
jgi:hypothetical protein